MFNVNFLICFLFRAILLVSFETICMIRFYLRFVFTVRVRQQRLAYSITIQARRL